MKTAEQLKVRIALAAEVAKLGSKFEITKKEVGLSSPRHVLLKVQACGICHSDSAAIHGGFPNLKYPIVPGHEIVGIVEEVGAECKRLKKGDRVGVGWYGGHCGICTGCRRGDFIVCSDLQTPGITYNGGYAEYGSFPEEACVIVPTELSSVEAAPLLCAGVTTFNALRHAGALSGDVVGVLGLGGLGHLGVQFANKMGYNTVAIARGGEKGPFAKQLGAHHYIDSEKQNVAEELKKLGGAKVILATVTSSKAMSPLIDGLAVGGRLVVLGADVEPLQINPIPLILARRSVVGWPCGTDMDSQDCLQFAVLTGIRPMVERFPFKDVTAAYDHMMSGKARFRAVLEF